MTEPKMSPYAFKVWLETAKRGAKCMYHMGFLMRDQDSVYNPLDWMKIQAIAVTAWNAYETQLCTLVQRKTSDGLYEYLAIRL